MEEAQPDQELHTLLVDAYRNTEKLKYMLKGAGVLTQEIHLQGSPVLVVHRALEAVYSQQKLHDVCQTVLADPSVLAFHEPLRAWLARHAPRTEPKASQDAESPTSPLPSQSSLRSHDPFLQRVLRERPEALRLPCLRLFERDPQRVERWFQNFDARDKELALRLFGHIEHYDYDAFHERLEQLVRRLRGKLREATIEESSVVIAGPDELGDSAGRHAYDLSKVWPGRRALRLGELTAAATAGRPPSAIVWLNDTHGSGNQFVREDWPQLAPLHAQGTSVFLLTFTLAREAHEHFHEKLPKVRITLIPDLAASRASDVFSEDELARLRELGERVYPKHPMGYGGTQLLVAYEYQCPNNTLPLVWADGRNNGGYPWAPLFPYRPKKRIAEDSES